MKINHWQLNSMRLRLFVGGAVLIVLALLFSSAAFINSFYDVLVEKEFIDKEELIYDLFGAMQIDKATNKINIPINNTDLLTPTSGLYAYIQDISTREIAWASESLNDPDSQLAHGISAEPGESIKDILPIPGATQYNITDNITDSLLFFALGITVGEQNLKYQIVVTSTHDGYAIQQAILGDGLKQWLLVAATIIILGQVFIITWIMRPIQKLAKEIKHIESADQKTINSQYPSELQPLKTAINSLISFEHGQKQRYRDALDDLAHSLKNPLAVIRTQIRKLGHEDQYIEKDNIEETREVLGTQINRMDEIIAYQLRKAVVSDINNMVIAPEKIRPVLFRLKDMFQKVYFDKGIRFELNVDDTAACRIEKDDMMELFGNLLDNACKHCESSVIVTSTRNGNEVILDIDDDGMGFQMENPQDLLQRGIRADSHYEGQGIGMAASTEVVSAVGGHIELLVSPQAGARVRLHLPV